MKIRQLLPEDVKTGWIPSFQLQFSISNNVDERLLVKDPWYNKGAIITVSSWNKEEVTIQIYKDE